MIIIDEVLYFYQNNLNSITKSKWSPKRLDVIQAFEEQLDFFGKMDFLKLFEDNVEHILKPFVLIFP